MKNGKFINGWRSSLVALCGVLVAVSLLAVGQQAPTPPAPVQAITVAMLEQRLSDLKAGKEQAVANVNAFEGAIQETQHWLDALKAGVEAELKRSFPEIKEVVAAQ